MRPRLFLENYWEHAIFKWKSLQTRIVEVNPASLVTLNYVGRKTFRIPRNRTFGIQKWAIHIHKWQHWTGLIHWNTCPPIRPFVFQLADRLRHLAPLHLRVTARSVRSCPVSWSDPKFRARHYLQQHHFFSLIRRPFRVIVRTTWPVNRAMMLVVESCLNGKTTRLRKRKKLMRM